MLFKKNIYKQYRKFSYPSNRRWCQFVHHFVATKLFHKSRWTLIFYRLQIILVAQYWNTFWESFVVIISELNINCHCFSNNIWIYYYFEGNLYSLDQNLTMSREWKREWFSRYENTLVRINATHKVLKWVNRRDTSWYLFQLIYWLRLNHLMTSLKSFNRTHTHRLQITWVEVKTVKLMTKPKTELVRNMRA